MSTLMSLVRRALLGVWLLKARLKLRRVGMRLQAELAPGGAPAGRPFLEIFPAPGGRRDGTLRLVIGPRAWIGPGVVLQVQTTGKNELILAPGARLEPGARLKLHGGSIEIGEGAIIEDSAVLKSSGRIVIGPRCRVSYGAVIHCNEHVEMGEASGLGNNGTLVDSEHLVDGSDRSWSDHPISSAPIVIGRHTMLASGATALQGTTVGPNAKVGAGALLSGDYPAGALIVGSPARVVRMLPAAEESADAASARSPG